MASLRSVKSLDIGILCRFFLGVIHSSELFLFFAHFANVAEIN